MGQCSTLPTEGRTANASKRSETASTGHDSSTAVSSSMYKSRQQHAHASSNKDMGHKSTAQSKKSGFLHVQTQNLNGQAGNQFPDGRAEVVQHQQHPHGKQPSPRRSTSQLEPNGQHSSSHHQASMQQHSQQQARGPEWKDPRSGAGMEQEKSPREPFPKPPEIAVRTRCYKLNLDADIIPHSGAFLGPFSDSPPPLTYSDSEDSAEMATPVEVAVKTAKIFRGISVSKDGTILSQNARATRSSRGNKNKRGEKSRQATKIDKAKDLVEECIRTGKAPDSDTPANMLSIVVLGEYDEMKHLVRDGAKKLRDGMDKPDVSLLSVNRPRGGMSPRHMPPSSISHTTGGAPAWSPRKRLSPHDGSMLSQQQRQSGGSMSDHLHQRTTLDVSVNSASVRSRVSAPVQPMSSPRERLRAHPRDRIVRSVSARRQGVDGNSQHRTKMDVTNMQDGSGRHQQAEGDWSNISFSRGFHSIWNCGGGAGEESGTISPTQVVSNREAGKTSYHHHHPVMATGGATANYNNGTNMQTGGNTGTSSHFQSNKQMFEGRENHMTQVREGGIHQQRN